uniref:DNA 5'-3' helicase n=1 Tax=Sonderella linearis TaxID=110477 RepID=A0A1Z1MMX2_9FLOR|nr:Replication helicase subunit [Sonderella linearis]ARW67114.1 Replication helicase subunit [Sonderella linearis]
MNILYKKTFLPNNYIAEEILLGIILIYPNIFSHVMSNIQKEYFFLESNYILYINLEELYQSNKLDIMNLLYKLEFQNILNTVGGLKRITNLMKQSQVFIFSTKLNFYLKEIIQIIKQYYIKRLIIQCGHNIIQLGYVNNINNNYLYNKAYHYLNTIKDKEDSNNKIVNFKDLIIKKLLNIKNNNLKEINQQKPLRSRFSDLDKIISGFTNGDLIIIAGRPSIGKTSFVISTAYQIFSYNKISILIFSLEMSSIQLLNKFMAIASNISIEKFIKNKIQHQEWTNIRQICNQLFKNNIYINDKQNVTINYIEDISKNLIKNTINIKLIIIDYLQLISLITDKKHNRSQELSYITRKLKLLAQFLELPVIVISQLNRNIESRNDKKPLLSDLKESGCIEQQINTKISISLHNDINLININNICNNLIQIKNTDNKITKFKKIFNLKIKQKIYIFQKYVFNCFISKKQFKILLTNNHKYLFQYKWQRTDKISKFITINYIKQSNKKIQIYNKYIYNITFIKYEKSYDLNTEQYFNLVCEDIIIHNSIEQDADMVMMLYQQSIKNENIIFKEEKIIDLIICKNRNGPVGSCQIKFINKTTKFKTISKYEKQQNNFI